MEFSSAVSASCIQLKGPSFPHRDTFVALLLDPIGLMDVLANSGELSLGRGQGSHGVIVLCVARCQVSVSHILPSFLVGCGRRS